MISATVLINIFHQNAEKHLTSTFARYKITQNDEKIILHILSFLLKMMKTVNCFFWSYGGVSKNIVDMRRES
jgi:hypothetical protein